MSRIERGALLRRIISNLFGPVRSGFVIRVVVREKIPISNNIILNKNKKIVPLEKCFIFPNYSISVVILSRRKI